MSDNVCGHSRRWTGTVERVVPGREARGLPCEIPTTFQSRNLISNPFGWFQDPRFLPRGTIGEAGFHDEIAVPSSEKCFFKASMRFRDGSGFPWILLTVRQHPRADSEKSFVKRPNSGCGQRSRFQDEIPGRSLREIGNPFGGCKCSVTNRSDTIPSRNLGSCGRSGQGDSADSASGSRNDEVPSNRTTKTLDTRLRNSGRSPK